VVSGGRRRGAGAVFPEAREHGAVMGREILSLNSFSKIESKRRWGSN